MHSRCTNHTKKAQPKNTTIWPLYGTTIAKISARAHIRLYGHPATTRSIQVQFQKESHPRAQGTEVHKQSTHKPGPGPPLRSRTSIPGQYFFDVVVLRYVRGLCSSSSNFTPYLIYCTIRAKMNGYAYRSPSTKSGANLCLVLGVG